MSRCTHGYPSTNSRRNHPPAIDPAPRPPEFFTSAMSDLRRSRYSSHSGNGQQRSPARSPASRTSASRASSFPIAPIATWPSATTTAPVSVAISMTAAGLKRRTYESASHRIRRPSASVLMISIVLPKWLFTTSPGFTAWPEGRFSVAGMSPTTLTFGLSSPSVSNVPSTAAAPDMSNFMSSMFRSEEHTSELQSHRDLVCRLLLEKKKKNETSDKNKHQKFTHCDYLLNNHAKPEWM